MKLCASCHGGCCRRYNPHLWGSDIIKICETLNIDINFFTTALPISEDKIDEYKEKTPLFIFTDNGEAQYFSLIIKFNESKYFPGTSKCIFLQEWSAEALGSEKLSGIIGRCGIYSCRPIGCASYPAKYDEKQKRIIIRDPHLILEKEHKVVDDNPAYKICSKTLSYEDYNIFNDDYVKSAILNHHEKEYFYKVAEKWNKNPDKSDYFYDFLVKEYDNRIKLINK